MFFQPIFKIFLCYFTILYLFLYPETRALQNGDMLLQSCFVHGKKLLVAPCAIGFCIVVESSYVAIDMRREWYRESFLP